jgi:predicted Zn-dependent peptidase
MNWIGEQLTGYGRIFSISEVKRRLRALVPGDIQAVAQAFFKPERMNLAIVSSLKSDRGLGALLRM